MMYGAATSAARVVESRTTTETVRTAEIDSKASRSVAVGQAVDEDRDERGREDAAQDDVVEHVGRGVGEVVRVGQRRLAQRPGQGDEAEQPGDARDAGPDADVGGRGPQREGPGPAGDGHGQCARGRARRDRRHVRTHHTRRTAPARTVRATPTKEISVDCTVSTVWAMSSWPSGRVQRHVDGQPVTRGAGLRGHPDRGRGAVERQRLRVAVGEGELVAVQRHDDAHRVGGRREHGDGDGRPLRR